MIRKRTTIYDYYYENVPAGYFEIEQRDEYVILWNLQVYEKFRGKGHGKKIVEGIKKMFDHIRLFVDNDNITAINLYTKAGFTETGIESIVTIFTNYDPSNKIAMRHDTI